MITCRCKIINDSHWPIKSIPMSCRLNYRFWWIRVPTHHSWVIWEKREQCWAMGELWSFEIFAPEKCFFCSLETRDSLSRRRRMYSGILLSTRYKIEGAISYLSSCLSYALHRNVSGILKFSIHSIFSCGRDSLENIFTI